ncbi:DUF465 domain-containing protein [Sphingorhabdus sp. Alg239-R122]|uniref:DUF465 domain-containing protein n=1 Tax=Sphingorhabdus sp. Alg239-R122 TaxID=2305989 RepID=UPI0013DD0E6B|nr:DUF465 domain-containing protein [Sphingorhabdus sp. Alg239-R122]
MSDSHINALQEKHNGLEEKIHAEELRPAPDTQKLAQLKKEKLKIKEELTMA